MSFVNPLFFIGMLAATVPVLLHLVRRERDRKLEFSTLMFLRRISKKTIRWQRLRHLLLMLLRVLSLLLLALAFTRPYREMLQAGVLPGETARTHVILLDNSMSMGYADRWARAKQAAAEIVRRAGPGDSFALAEFSDVTLIRAQAVREGAAILALVEGDVRLTDRATRYGQALSAASQLLPGAGASRKTIHLISDFQKSGWAAEEVNFRLGAGTDLEVHDVGSDTFSNIALGELRLSEGDEKASGNYRVRLTAFNYGTSEHRGVRVALRLDGKQQAEKTVDLGANGSAAVEFDLADVIPGEHTLTVEAGSDELRSDNRLTAVLEARGKKSALSIENPGAGRFGRAPGFFLEQAVNIPSFSPFRLTRTAPAAAEIPAGSSGTVVIWNSARGGKPGLAAQLRAHVEAGGGLVAVLADGGIGPDFNRVFGSWLPVTVGPGTAGRAGEFVLLTDIRMDHPIFRPFAEPHSGSFSNAKFFRHAQIDVGEGGEVLARFDNGDVALASFSVGKGRVLVFASSADDAANDLPLKAVYAPFWQQMLRYLDVGRQERPWVEVGETIQPRRLLVESVVRRGGGEPDPDQAMVLVDPDRRRIPIPAQGDAAVVERAGLHEIRALGSTAFLAANPVLRESDLARGSVEEMKASWMAAAEEKPLQAAQGENATPQELDRRQRWWQYLLLAVLVFLIAECLLGNRMSSNPGEGGRP